MNTICKASIKSLGRIPKQNLQTSNRHRNTTLKSTPFKQKRLFSQTTQRSPPTRAERLKPFGNGTSVWTEFTPLAQKHKAVNLGQGFPDFEADKFVIDAASNAIKNHLNQYTRSQGHLRLVQALGRNYSPSLNRQIDPLTEVVVTIGATEALFATIQAVINPGDEAILIEPFYDSYPVDIIISGGIPKYVPLRSKNPNPKTSADWALDFDELESQITSKTKLLIVNTPQNIPGKVYSQHELEKIAHIVKKHNLILISDEVYESMIYNDVNPRPPKIASFPGMFERTLTIGSAGKTFSVTGWKTGWVVGPKELVEGIWIVHQNNTFCSTTPLQEAIAVGFEKALDEGKYFPELQREYQRRRDKLCNILKEIGLTPVQPQGSYFVLADTSSVPSKLFDKPEYYAKDGTTPSTRDYLFCRWLTSEIGVAAIPPTAFYSPGHAHIAEKYARFCFCKKDETMDEAARRLQKLKSLLNK